MVNNLQKFNRVFVLEIQTAINSTTFLELKYPLTIQFDIDRSISNSMNQANIKIYNLSEGNRNQIYQDRFNNKEYKQIILKAGYGLYSTTAQKNQLTTIFKGNIQEAYFYRQGPDIVTLINATDGGYSSYNSYSSVSFNAGQTLDEAFKKITEDLTTLTLGPIGTIPGTFNKGVTFSGNSMDILRKNFTQAGQLQTYVDLEKLCSLQVNEVIGPDIQPIRQITSTTGLLQVPRRQSTILTIETIFEPDIILGQLVQIKSQINSRFDGEYKVIGIKHNGIISGSVGGNCTTILQIFKGDPNLGGLTEVS